MFMRKIPFTYLKSSGSRNIVFKTQNGSIEIDPNRIWTDKGIENLLISDKNANDVIALLKEIRKTIIGFILDNSINSIISVHNNYNKNFNILAYYHNPVYSYVAENIHINKNISSGNFYYVTMRQDFETLKELNYNVVLQKPYNAFLMTVLYPSIAV